MNMVEETLKGIQTAISLINDYSEEGFPVDRDEHKDVLNELKHELFKMRVLVSNINLELFLNSVQVRTTIGG